MHRRWCAKYYCAYEQSRILRHCTWFPETLPVIRLLEKELRCPSTRRRWRRYGGLSTMDSSLSSFLLSTTSSNGRRTERALQISLFSLSVSPAPMPLPKHTAAKSGALVTFFFFAATANVSFTTVRPVKSGGWNFPILPLQSNCRPFFPLKADLMCE